MLSVSCLTQQQNDPTAISFSSCTLLFSIILLIQPLLILAFPSGAANCPADNVIGGSKHTNRLGDFQSQNVFLQQSGQSLSDANTIILASGRSTKFKINAVGSTFGGIKGVSISTSDLATVSAASSSTSLLKQNSNCISPVVGLT
jgi:hypothetical protein